MSFTAIGDLALSFQLRRDNAALSGEMRRLATELSTGLKTDLSAAVGGDFGSLGGIETALKRISGFQANLIDQKVEASARQTALESIQTYSDNLTPALLLANDLEQATQLNITGREAYGSFERVVEAFNTFVGGRALFAGDATDAAALADVATIMTELETLVAAETTAAGVETVLDAWFAPADGFETVGFVGSATGLADVPVAAGESVSADFAADDLELRETFKGFALGALLSDGSTGLALDERVLLAGRAAEVLINGNTDLVSFRARVGMTEEQLEIAETRNASEEASLEIARLDIISADPFETASRLEETQARIESLYVMTSRLSQLSLVDYLR